MPTLIYYAYETTTVTYLVPTENTTDIMLNPTQLKLSMYENYSVIRTYHVLRLKTTTVTYSVPI